MRYVVWLVTLPFRSFEAVASRFVKPSVDYRPSQEELLRQREYEIEAMETRYRPPG